MTEIQKDLRDDGGEKTLILVLGMHRSGTSTLTGSLQQMGLYLGDVSEKNPHNPKGNRENPDIMELNETLLGYNGGSWYDPPATVIWDASHTRRREAILKGLMASNARAVGFKDPRTLITFPFWENAYKHTKFVGIFRHPLKVAESIFKRNNRIGIHQALGLYAKYNTLLIRYQQRYDIPLVCFDSDKEVFMTRTRRIAGDLGLQVDPGGNAEPFYDEKLISSRATPDDRPLPGDVLKIYQTLLKTFERQ